MEKLRFMLIGCGRISKNHITATAENKDTCVLAAVCDPVRERAEQKAADYEALTGSRPAVYEDYRKALEELEIDCCTVATESGYHAAIALDCIAHGKNVLIEKPIALSTADAEEILAKAKEKGVTVGVCHQNRFNPPVRQMRRALESGRFGKLINGTARILWNRTMPYYQQAPWRGTWELDGGTLMNQCIHGIDLLRWMMGGDPVEVMAITDNLNHPYIEAEDIGLALFKFRNGSYGVLEGTVNTYPENLDETLSVYGEKGSVRIGGIATNRLVEYHVEGETRSFDELSAEVNTEPKNVYGFGHSFLYADVIDAIQNHRQPYVPLEEGLKALEMVLAVYKSGATGKPVRFPLGDYSTLDVLKDRQ